MLYNLLHSLDKIIMSLILCFSCNLKSVPDNFLKLADTMAWTQPFVDMDISLRREIMNSSEVYLEFPELNYSVPVKYCFLNTAQDYVDMPNMAAMFHNTMAEYPGQLSFEIGDHNNQGFDIINRLSPGMKCIINFNDVEINYICTRVDKEAFNRFDCLEFSDGTLLDSSYPLGIYTCSTDGVHITLCAFEPE